MQVLQEPNDIEGSYNNVKFHGKYFLYVHCTTIFQKNILLLKKFLLAFQNNPSRLTVRKSVPQLRRLYSGLLQQRSGFSPGFLVDKIAQGQTFCFSSLNIRLLTYISTRISTTRLCEASVSRNTFVKFEQKQQGNLKTYNA